MEAPIATRLIQFQQYYSQIETQAKKENADAWTKAEHGRLKKIDNTMDRTLQDLEVDIATWKDIYKPDGSKTSYKEEVSKMTWSVRHNINRKAAMMNLINKVTIVAAAVFAAVGVGLLATGGSTILGVAGLTLSLVLLATSIKNASHSIFRDQKLYCDNDFLAFVQTTKLSNYSPSELLSTKINTFYERYKSQVKKLPIGPNSSTWNFIKLGYKEHENI